MFLWDFISPGSSRVFEAALSLLHTSKLGEIPAAPVPEQRSWVASVTSVCVGELGK